MSGSVIVGHKFFEYHPVDVTVFASGLVNVLRFVVLGLGWIVIRIQHSWLNIGAEPVAELSAVPLPYTRRDKGDKVHEIRLLSKNWSLMHKHCLNTVCMTGTRFECRL